MLFQALRNRRRRRERAQSLYVLITRAARDPAFYSALEVPDTLDARFDLVVLHAHLILRRLKEAGAEGPSLAQALLDTIFTGMDEALRELGVGDVSVGRKIRDMTRAFYGRAVAYEEALQSNGAQLQAALIRNVYRGKPPDGAALAALEGYVRGVERSLSQSPDDAILTGAVQWPPLVPVSCVREV